jgi:hypothetical protein
MDAAAAVGCRSQRQHRLLPVLLLLHEAAVLLLLIWQQQRLLIKLHGLLLCSLLLPSNEHLKRHKQKGTK